MLGFVMILLNLSLCSFLEMLIRVFADENFTQIANLSNVTDADSGDTYDALLMSNITLILNTLLEGYDRSFRPGIKGPPVVVTVDVSVLSIGPISEQNMDFAMDCYFRQKWIDERLRFRGPINKLHLNAVKFVGSIWKPDTYIRNGLNSYLHRITVPNKMLRLTENGSLLISQRLTLIPKCPMFLKKFPMDTQACPVEIGSLGYTNHEMVFKWGALSVSDEVKLSQYSLDAFYYGARDEASFVNPNDSVSTLVVHFKLSRQAGFYLLQIYIPCMMIVALSWVSFWINKDASPARVALGVMTVLTMSTIGSGGARSHLPKVSYSTGLDLYIVACFGFVFTALVEFAVINFTNRMYWRHKQKEARAKQVMAASMALFAGAVAAKSPQMQNRVQEIRSQIGRKEEAIEQLMERQTMMEMEQDQETTLYSPRQSNLFSTPNNINNNNSLDNLGLPRPSILRSRSGHNSITSGDSIGAYVEPAERVRSKNNFGNRGDNEGARGGMEDMFHEQTVVDYIDDVSKIIFPGMFIVFNGIYWASYLYWLPDECDTVLSNTYAGINFTHVDLQPPQ